MENRYNRNSYRIYFSWTVIFCIGLTISILNGCKGDAGPVGPAGPSNVNMYTFSFTAYDLITDGDDTTIYYKSFSNSTIANTISSGAAVLLYMESSTSALFALPYTEPHNPTLSITYSFRDHQWLDIDVRTNFGFDARRELILFLNGDTSYIIRLIVIPANNVYLPKIIQGNSSYSEIKKMFNLQD
ncbi:MAG: hypothetical protein ABR936_09950 [Bacteroidota bacterium]|jgi:hypothetical protein